MRISKNKIIKKKYVQRIININFENYFIIKILFMLFINLFPFNNSKQRIFIGKYKRNNNNSLLYIKKNKNQTIFLKEKDELLKYISKYIKVNITHINYIILGYKCHFGNQLIILNKVIFYCKIIKCKKILLNKKIYWFIRKKIIIKKYKISIEIANKKDYINRNAIIDKSLFFFEFFNYLYPQYNSEILKNEILRNLPKIKTSKNNIYIYIRSGDVFKKFHKSYFQPPLCFYKKILNYFKFKKIYIIAENSNNPVINKLLAQFPNIIYNKNSLIYDISYLSFAYNIVGAISTFLKNIIKFNDNLKSFWIFKFKLSLFTTFLFSYEFNHKNIFIYQMKEIDYYNKVILCKNLKCREDLILNYNCKNNFETIKY